MAVAPDRKEKEEASTGFYQETGVINADLLLYHVSKDSSRLYYRIQTNELLYARKDRNAPFKARLRFSFQLKNKRGGPLLDSSSVRVTEVDRERTKKELTGYVTLHTGIDKKGVMKVDIRDLNRKKSSSQVLEVDRSNKNTPQNFLLEKPGQEQPFFRNYLKRGEPFRIRTQVEVVELLGRYYDRDFPLPPPPFSSVPMQAFNYEADSLFRVSLTDSGTVELQAPDSGMYHFRFDTLTRSGLTIHRFRKGFPEVNTVDAMLGPLRYLTTEKEFKELKDSENLKKAIDEFWLNCGGSHERSRKLIKNYYNRVETANRYFSSYTEGWKTDRGLIYIMFGRPNVISKEEGGETWTYGEEDNMMSLTFSFYKVKNPFSDNDHNLDRNQLYQTSWYRAVESWRNGRVYSN